MNLLISILILPISFLFHLVVYENYWNQSVFKRIVIGIFLIVLPFLAILYH